MNNDMQQGVFEREFYKSHSKKAGMILNDFNPKQIAEATIQKGIDKANTNKLIVSVLAFIGGAFIALGFLAFVRITGTLPEEWGSLSTFIGAAVFPIGLILILLGGGELLTGNMMAISMAVYAKKVKFVDMIKNWSLVGLFNLLGAMFVAYAFGHLLGLTEGAFLAKTVAVAEAKVADSFWLALISGIGCNWLVGMAVWLSFGAKDFSGKILAIWFPTMTFVLIGFQHVVANMFIIPAAVFAGELTWMEFIANLIPVFIGNTIGGAVLVSLLYFVAYKKEAVPQEGISIVKKQKIS